MSKVVPFQSKKDRNQRAVQQAKEIQAMYEAAMERKRQTGIDMIKLLAGDPREQEKLERIRRKNAMGLVPNWEDDEW